MMIPFDTNTALMGLVIGAMVSGLFFAGLGLGMRMALRAKSPVPILVLSAVIRMALLLGVGWGVASMGGAWALAAYAAAFIIVRTAATSIARLGGAK
jgi:F1F0 ATPase subunit 2